MIDSQTIGTLIVIDGRVVLERDGVHREISAVEIFQVAIRGTEQIQGMPVSSRVDLSAPGVIFRSEPSEVVLHVTSRESTATGGPAIRHRGSWAAIGLQSDHTLIENDWYPLAPESRGAVAEWILAHPHATEQLAAADYLSLYRGLKQLFRVVDDLSDKDVDNLAGGSPSAIGLTASLYPYQSDGLRWLSARARAGLGGILADEMGLGKTLQIIALIMQRRGAAQTPALIIVPATLIENWARELTRFCPALQVYRHSGPDRTRRPSELAKPDVVLVSYETAAIDEPVLDQIRWDLVIADEAQAIKNPDAQRSRAARGLRGNAEFAVTGTPLENRTLDTWSLADFAVPGYLGSRQDFTAVLEAEPELLSRALKPLILRREVKEVAKDLPQKIEVDVALEMFAPEAGLYDGVREVVRGDRGRAPILSLLTKLRMFTAHPDCVYGLAPHPEARSAKLTRLFEILEETVAEASKTLIFVAFHRASDIIVTSIMRRFSIPVWPIDGRTPISARQGTIDQFSAIDGPAVLVLNPGAAGTGLNIQAATHVVHYTLEWNPARESQATARAWRRGQALPVTVHRLYYVSSIDEIIRDRLTLKRDLFDTVIQPSALAEDGTVRDLLDRALALGRTPSQHT